MIFTTGAQKLQSPSASDLQALRVKFQDEPWNGILEADNSKGDKFILLFAGGLIKCSYHLRSNATEKKDADEAWSALLQSPPVELTFLALGVSGLRLVRILVEHPAPAEILTLDSVRIDRLFEQWIRQGHPNLAVVKCKEGQALFMLWPDASASVAAVLISSEGIWQDGDAVAQILSLETAGCDASRHAFVSDAGAWEGFSFQWMFARLLTSLLARYKELTGLALLNALDRNINRVALEHKWDFSVTLGNISDQMFFSDMDETLAACKTLLEVVVEHVGVVLGQKLSRNLLQDSIVSLDRHSIHMIEKYSIGAFLGLPRTFLAAGEHRNE